MTKTHTIGEAAASMERAGILFAYGPIAGGSDYLPAKDVDRYVADPVAYEAALHGVTPAELEAWAEACGTIQAACAGTTKRGTKCNALGHNFHFRLGPDWSEALRNPPTFYCVQHADQE